MTEVWSQELEGNFTQDDPILTDLTFPEFDPNSPIGFSLTPDPLGLPRLLGTEQSEIIELFQGQLSPYSDGIWALAGDDRIIGSVDDEQIFSNEGEDLVYGGEGRDRIFGGKQNDEIFGEDGNDFLRGDLEQDILNGGTGDDQIFGGKDNDQLFGDEGQDILSGDLGTDTLTGGGNTDIFILRTDEATFDLQKVDIITDFDWFSQGDKIALTDGILESDLSYQEFIDFDRDGVVNDTVITLVRTGEILGIVLNADDFALNGQFISADLLNLG